MSSFYDDASLVVIPSGYKTSKVYAEKPTDGSGDLAFTRTGDTATRVNSAGLIEKVRTNLLTRSQEFDNAAWTKDRTTVTANATTAPDGTATADKVVDTLQGANAYRIYNGVTLSAISYSASFYVKAAEYSWVYIRIGNSLRVWFNVSTGVVGNNDSGITGVIQSAGNGWYRCTAIIATATAGGGFSLLGLTNANGIETYTPSTGGQGVFVWGAQLETTDFGATPYIPTTTAAVSVGPVANVPRLDYLNSSCPKLQLEPSRTNIFPKSESSDTWSFTNMTRTGNHGIAPDGYQSADLLAPTTSGVVNFTSDSTTSSLTIGQPFVCSFFIKLNQSFNSNIGQNIIDLRLGGSATWTRPTVRINLATGSVTEIQNASYLSSTNYGNGWFRITFGAIPTGTTNATQLQIPTGTTMDGGSFYIWGLQGEANATYATSYIPTLGAAVTRGADACSKTGISSLIGQTEGTMFLDLNLDTRQSFSYFLITPNLATPTSYIGIGILNNIIQLEVVNSGVQASITFTNTSAGRFKIAAAYKQNDFAFYVNGTLVGTDTSGTVPACSALNLFVTGSNIQPLQYNQAALFPTRLTNATLAQLTTL